MENMKKQVEKSTIEILKENKKFVEKLVNKNICLTMPNSPNYANILRESTDINKHTPLNRHKNCGSHHQDNSKKQSVFNFSMKNSL